jgi:predicted glycoside hydrolase/deacetylase ChbG (UPF0249 family)
MNQEIMKRTIALLFIIFFAGHIAVQSQDEIRLLVRGDDIGSFTAANHACIASCNQGIVRSLELMTPCAWFPEAVTLLNENPHIDVGVHITLTSEWTNCKWRPLTDAPSLTDDQGYFYPFIWPNRNQAGLSIQEAKWELREIEAEFRAQIELAKKLVKNVTHISTHMGCAEWNDDIRATLSALAKEYGLFWETTVPLSRFPRMNVTNTDPAEKRIAAFIEALGKLEPGNTYLFVEHPGYDTPEMQKVGHVGYEHVAQDRDGVTQIFTDRRVIDFIRQKGIRLVSYNDVNGK